jgi:hypothetical protein
MQPFKYQQAGAASKRQPMGNGAVQLAVQDGTNKNKKVD